VLFAPILDGMPLRFDVKNQARVHLWYGARFGCPIAPYASVADAVATYPTTATAIALRREGGRLACIAPFGLDDLFAADGAAQPPAGQRGRLPGQGGALAGALAGTHGASVVSGLTVMTW
jgi:hypothetical protein